MTSSNSATALAHPNIAFIKYWGNRDESLHIPSSSSISMNLADIFTQTQVILDLDLVCDELTLNGAPASQSSQQRVQNFLDQFRKLSGKKEYCRIFSTNNFPTSAGIASSASGFAALTLAAAKVYQLDINPLELSRIARLGSGSASRSIPGGFVQWVAGYDHQSSFAESFAPPDHWNLVDCIAVIGDDEKKVSSLEGHRLANSSPLQSARLESANSRIETCHTAILKKDFVTLSEVVELDTNLMVAIMITSRPALFYWQPASLAVVFQVLLWRQNGLPVFYTLDAGASVHVICPRPYSRVISSTLRTIPGVIQVIHSGVGGPAHIIEENI